MFEKYAPSDETVQRRYNMPSSRIAPLVKSPEVPKRINKENDEA